MSSAEGDDRRRSESAGLPDHDDFDQYVTQAEVDRDPFAIALFEVKPINHDSTALLNRLGQTLLQFASPTTHVAYLGRNRFGLLSHSDDTTQRWVAPVAGALRVTLDCWLTEEVSYAVARQELESKRASATPGSRLASSLSGVVADLDVDVSDLLERTTLMTGVARGLSREVWINAEQALARAYKQRIPVAEYRQTDHLVDPPIRLSDRHDDPPIRVSDRHDDRPEAALTTYPNRGEAETIDHVTMVSSNRPTDDRLVVLSRRLEPVNRPEPIWHWLRLIPGLRTRPGQLATAIQLNGLAVGERALIEIWLANQVADLFAQASTKLRLSIPLSIEACQARSFAQRIFPLLE
ncbi:MAG: hypothetical protein OER95_15865, partial [Acidimicrobiia bacterium]|nr:hypothetical protein [Acidimicrobiia bacterium]